MPHKLRVAVALAFILPFTVQAASPEPCVYRPFGPANLYHLFVLETLDHQSGDTEGRVYVGGTGKLASYHIGDKMLFNKEGVPADGGHRYALVIQNDFQWTAGDVWNGLVAYCNARPYFNSVGWRSPALAIGGKQPLWGEPIEAYVTRACSSFSPRDAGEYLNSLSDHWLALESSGVTALAEPGLINLEGGRRGLNVFNVAAEKLKDATKLRLSVPEGATVLINVTGCEDRRTPESIRACGAQIARYDFRVSGVANNRLIWNFPRVGQLVLKNIGMPGSILAPWAEVDFESGHLNGGLIAKSLRGRFSQFNYPHFEGCMPVPAEAPKRN